MLGIGGGGAGIISSAVRAAVWTSSLSKTERSSLLSVSACQPITAILGSNLQVRHQVLLKMNVIVRPRAHVRVKQRVVRVGGVCVSLSG